MPLPAFVFPVYRDPFLALAALRGALQAERERVDGLFPANGFVHERVWLALPQELD